MIHHEDLSSKAKSWIDGKISKLKELKERSPAGGTAQSEAIERLFLDKKRSISPVPDASLEGLRREIRASVAEGRPIRLISSFGCYKPSNLPSPTTANWAEFIHLAYMAEISSHISSLHDPGVEVVYKLGDIDMDLLADVTEESICRYFQTFKDLARQFGHWVPQNVKFQVSRLSDYVSKEEFRQATEVEIARLRPIWEENRSSGKIAEVCDRTKRNNSKLDLSEREIFEKALYSAAVLVLDLRYLFEEKAIHLIYRKITDLMVQSQHGTTLFPFRSSSGSLVQFWVGEGGLVWNGKKVYPIVFGQNSIQKANVLQVIDSYEFKEWGPNFSRIAIYEK